MYRRPIEPQRVNTLGRVYRMPVETYYILQSTVKGGRRQGRQKKRWEDNIREWTDRLGVRQVPEGSGEQRKLEETGCEVICGASATLAVKGQVKQVGCTENQSNCTNVNTMGRMHRRPVIIIIDPLTARVVGAPQKTRRIALTLGIECTEDR